MLTLAEIEAEVMRLAGVIGADAPKLPTYGVTRDFGHQHVEVDAYRYHLVTVERGQELSRVSTRDLDELLYAVFDTATFTMANDYAIANRLPAQDFRRPLFEHQVKLLSALSPKWGQWKAAVQERTLRAHPYNDAAFRAARSPKPSVFKNILLVLGGSVFAAGGVWLMFHGPGIRDRMAGAGGLVLFGGSAVLGVSGLRPAGPAAQSPPMLRMLAYMPLSMGLLQGPWIIICVIGLMFIVGDKPMSNPQIAKRLFSTALCVPGAIGLMAAAVWLSVRAVRTRLQWICFIIGSLLCALFIAAVATGWIR
jgi:hypothetical protein